MRTERKSCSIERVSSEGGDESGNMDGGGAREGERETEREELAASQMNMKYPFRYKCVCVVV